MTIIDTIADDHYGDRIKMAMAFADLLNQEARALEKDGIDIVQFDERSEEHTSELQSLMRISYAVFCLKKKKQPITHDISETEHTNYTVYSYHTHDRSCYVLLTS